MENQGAAAAAAAAVQLATLQVDREAVAARAMQPWWHDAALGTLVFVAVAQFSLDSDVVSAVVPLAVVASLVLGVGAALLSRWWSRLYIAELRAVR